MLANRILIHNDDNNQLCKEFRVLVENHFKAVLDEVDFTKAGPIILAVNQWVEKITQGMITSILPKPPSPNTKLLLLNAIYFKGTWLKHFDPVDTSTYKFMNGGKKDNLIDVEMMVLRDVHMKYSATTLNGQKVQIVDVPYQGNMSMLIILPEKSDGLFGLTRDNNKSLAFTELAEKLSNLSNENLDLFLPKFKFEAQFLLNQPLQSLGITDAFDIQFADFTGMRREPGLFVSDAIHKAVIEVTEEGTTAAAVTSYDVVEGFFPRKKSTQVICEHPFLFLIMDNKRGLVLFVGETVEL